MTTVDYVQDARERLLAAIGDALERPATEEQQAEILAAIEKLVVVAGNEAIVAKADAYVVPTTEKGDPMQQIADVKNPTRQQLAVWRDRGYDDAENGRPAEDGAPINSKARAAYFQGYRGQQRAAANGDGIVSAQRHRRPVIG